VHTLHLLQAVKLVITTVKNSVAANTCFMLFGLNERNRII